MSDTGFDEVCEAVASDGHFGAVDMLRRMDRRIVELETELAREQDKHRMPDRAALTDEEYTANLNARFYDMKEAMVAILGVLAGDGSPSGQRVIDLAAGALVDDWELNPDG